MIFSVIIPVYKDEIRLNQCLNELSFQTFPKAYFEIIAINNFPKSPIIIIPTLTDNLNFRIVEEKSPGSYVARNKGIAFAKGKILAFTDADCLPTKYWLENAFKIFEQDLKKEIGILTGPVPLFFKDPKSLTDAEVYEKYTGFTTESYAKEGHVITANWFSPASVIKEFGGFNDNLKSNGDSELSGKISKKYRIVYSPNLIVHHPARYHTVELVNKYKRLLGGAYTRRFQGNPSAFRIHLFKFIWARYRFAIKRLFTLSPKESLPILSVCHAINLGAIQEYAHLVKGGETKR